MKISSKFTAGVFSILAILTIGLTSAQAQWSFQASGPWVQVHYADGWSVYQNGWGSPDYAQQTLYSNSPSNWASAGSFTNGGIKCYPHTQKDVDLPLDGNHYCNATFNVSVPNNPWYNFMFDNWTTNMQDEFIVCEQWNGDGTWGSQIAANVSIGGRTYLHVYQANNGANNVLIFTPTSKRTSGTTDVMALMMWAKNNGHLVNSSSFHQLSFGVEITYTSGWQQFTCNSYSASFGQNGGSAPGNGTYKIVSRLSGKAMEASGWGSADGTQILQWTYGGGNNQRWILTNRGSDQFSIIGVHSGKGLDINGASSANGAKVQLWTYGGNNNQKFTFTGTSGGYYRITPVHATGSCLDVSGYSTADGALVHQWAYGGGDNQQWALQTP
ncbi:MAG: RICIN domain-containing protein [Luteolibacter sp.]|uniref:RICIN domain-containing protein n=1 Tax=Luteolibacter sp. TaxID=1962973 RepID=UPI0032666BEB